MADAKNPIDNKLSNNTRNIPKSKLFTYTAKTRTGIKMKGHVQADTPALAKAQLKKQGLIKIRVYIKQDSLWSRLKGRVKATDIAIFSRQIATMSAAGIPLVQSLQVIIDGSEKKAVKTLVRAIKEDLETGKSFSEALHKHPGQFDDLFCNLVAAGERAGVLDVMLDRVALYKEKTETLKRKIKKALYYPIAVVFISMIVTMILLIKVVPTFKSMFDSFGAELPAFTQLVLNISDVTQDYGVLIVVAFILFVVLFIRSYEKNETLRHGLQRLSLKLPIFGSLIHKAIMARFARTLSTTFAAGLPLTEALINVAKAAGNVIYEKAILHIKDEVSSGQPMKVALQKTGLFPNMVVQMVGIGEESGTLESMLGKVANIYEEEVSTAVDGLTTLLEPLIMLFLGVVVGGLVIAMYLPIFKLGSVV